MYLNCHSQFSFRYGTIKTVDLLALAQKNGQKAIALTDINSTSACLNFVRMAIDYKVKPIVGIDFRNGMEQQFVGLAKNNAGFQELNEYLSHHLHEDEVIPNRAPDFKAVFVVYPFKRYKHQFIQLGDNEFMGISLDELKNLPFSPWREHQKKFVLLQAVTFQNKRDFNIHRLLRAIDKNTLLAKLQAKEQASPQQKMYSNEVLESALKDFPAIMKNTKHLLKSCTISFNYKGNKKSGTINHNKQTFKSTKDEDQKLIRSLCEQGLDYRYPDLEKQQEVLPRLEMELKAIHDNQFESYFLINWDMLRFAREKGFFYVGRGSGANSIVAYLLQITDVDPVKLDLYFERFINPYRENPPDFDIDFSWKDRDEVTAYLFEKYGVNNQIGLVATYNTFSYRSLVRELGKVFGLPNNEIELLVAEKRQDTVPDDYVDLIYKYAAYMDGIPNYLSVHAGGIIISEKPVHYYSATSMPPKGYPLLQFDMVHAEDAGLYKYDVLSQRGLGKIKDGLELVKKRGKEPDLDIRQTARFFEDEKIKELLRNGNAMGCFYVESPAMRMLLKKLKADTYLGLVAASSIIRPGVAKSGMMREYILRSQSGSEEWRKTTPKVMQELMEETFGVMVYQEDVIKVAHYFAGLDLGEADMLRRGMSGKFRSRKEFEKVRKKFFDNCKAKGYTNEVTAEVWRQTESFAGYAFSKGHSASYAVESYQSLYLKAHYPMEFIVGVLNNGGGFYSSEMYFHEARMLGAQLEAPCVNNSNILSVLKGKNIIYMGFYLVHELEEKTVHCFLQERERRGRFKNLANFIERCAISVAQLSLLIRVGAFRYSKKSKQELLWEVHRLLGKSKVSKPAINLFQTEQDRALQKLRLPKLDRLCFEDAYDQMELLGFPLCSPFELLKEKTLVKMKARDIMASLNKYIAIVGYLVTVKNTRTTKGQLMQFGTFVDDEGDWIDTVHFPPTVNQYPFRGKGCYLIKGKVVEEFGYATVEVTSMQRLEYAERGRLIKENNN